MDEDRGLTAEQLSEKYDNLDVDGWGEHPVYSMEDWREAVANHDTRRGYWAWVEGVIEETG